MGVKLRHPTSEQHSTQHSTQYTVQHSMETEVETVVGGEHSAEMVVTAEFVTKMNFLLVLMAVIFTLLCLLLAVCLAMLVYLWAQRRNNRVHSSKCCHHQSGRPEHFINNAISSHQFLTHSHQPKHIW